MRKQFDPKTREEYLESRLAKANQFAIERKQEVKYYLCTLCGMLALISSKENSDNPRALIQPDEEHIYYQENPCEMCRSFQERHPEVYRFMGLVAGHHFGMALPSKS